MADECHTIQGKRIQGGRNWVEDGLDYKLNVVQVPQRPITPVHPIDRVRAQHRFRDLGRGCTAGLHLDECTRSRRCG
jgi:hypothetical protein